MLPKSGGPVNIVVSPDYANDLTIFAGIEKSLYRSNNAGQTWQIISTPSFLFEQLEISPNFKSDQTLYAGDYSNGVYRSTNGGLTWN